MQFGVREICDVVFKAKSTMKVGKKVFYKGEPVIYFDSLTTSSLEGAATTVYAQGGRGNARLIAWEGERTVTFTMEDALMSPAGFMILSGAGLINEASSTDQIIVHKIETTDEVTVTSSETPTVTIVLSEKPVNPTDNTIKGADGAGTYVFDLDENGSVYTEPFIPDYTAANYGQSTQKQDGTAGFSIKLRSGDDVGATYGNFKSNSPVLVDYYVAYTEGVTQVDITPESFGGNFYIEASTLFRNRATGKDMPAEFIIPSGKVQSNFTFTMAASGDPSTFTFTVDAFPDYTRFNKKKKVLAALQIIESVADSGEETRTKTEHAAG